MKVYKNMFMEMLKVIKFYHFTYRQNQLEEISLPGG